MKCQNCGEPNRDGSSICVNCGRDLDAPKRKTVAEPDEELFRPAQGAKRRTVVEPDESVDEGPFANALRPRINAGEASANSPRSPFDRAASAVQTIKGHPPPKGRTVVDTDDRPAGDSKAGEQGGGTNERRIVGFLVTFDGYANGRAFTLREGRNTIGRDPDRDISCNDAKMSGRHAVIQYRGGRVWIFDDNSENGTFVDEQDVYQERPTLADNNEIRLGRTRFLVKLLDPARVEQLLAPKP